MKRLTYFIASLLVNHAHNRAYHEKTKAQLVTKVGTHEGTFKSQGTVAGPGGNPINKEPTGFSKILQDPTESCKITQIPTQDP